MALNQTTTVQNIIDHCSLYTSLQTYFNVGGVTNEPALEICNKTLQMLLIRQCPWKFNRKELAGTERANGNFLVTQYGVQDYRFAGAVAFVLSSGSANPGGVGVDLASSPINGGSAGISVSAGIVTVQTLDPHPFQVGATVYMSGNKDSNYNSTYSFSATAHTSAWSNGWTITAVPDTLHFKFAATAGQVSSTGAPGFGVTNNLGVLTGLTAFGWLESAWLQDISSGQFPQRVVPIEAVRQLPVNYAASGNQQQVCMMIDYNNGVLKFRLSDPPASYPYQLCMVYQGKAPILRDQNAIFPWPDDMRYVLDEVALFHAFRFAKGVTSAEAIAQGNLAASIIGSALEAEARESSAYAKVPEFQLAR